MSDQSEMLIIASGTNSATPAPGPRPSAPDPAPAIIDSLAWPITVFATIILFVYSRRLQRLFSRLFRRLTLGKIKGGPFELEFSAETAKDVKASIQQDLGDFMLAADSEYERQARANDLDEALSVAKQEVVLAVGAAAPSEEIRATVHVRDVVFEGYLYQLLDYHPTGSGKGRRWSSRYGILGRSWRLGSSLCTNHALGYGAINPERELVESWGMTREEAQRGGLYKPTSCLCIVLNVGKRRVGVLYFDCQKEDVFHKAITTTPMQRALGASAHSKAQEIRDDIQSLPAVQELAVRVEAAMKELRAGATHITLGD